MASLAGKKRRPKLPATLQLGRSGVHGYGVFARDFIPQEERIIEYVGERITKREAERREAARLARRARREASRRSASRLVMRSPTYSMMRSPCGIKSRAKTP